MKTIPKCHPLKKYGARGLCVNCYNTWLRNNNPQYKKNCSNASNNARNTPQGKRKRNSSLLKQRYGISIEEKELLANKQNNLCKICKENRTLVVDHNHTTKVVRSLLCQRCNILVGQIENNKALLEAVFFYIDVSHKV